MEMFFIESANTRKSNVKSTNTGKSNAESADELRKEVEKFKEYITSKFCELQLESCNKTEGCKASIAELHGIIEEQDKKIQALEEKSDNIVGFTEINFSELNKRCAINRAEINELKCRLAKSEKAVYTKYKNEEGMLYYKCGNCHALMTDLGDDILYCPECKTDVLK